MSRVLGVIVAYKHRDVLHKCLQHAKNQDYKDIDWVVWNNGDINWLGVKLWHEVEVHNSEANVLWTPALNAAIETYLKPEHTHIFYMNHDIYLPTSAIRRLVEFLDGNPKAGAVGPVGSALGGLHD
jgi:GT2 family glycosyltransferase